MASDCASTSYETEPCVVQSAQKYHLHLKTSGEFDKPCGHWGFQSGSKSVKHFDKLLQCLEWVKHLKVYTLFNFKI